MNSRVCCTCKQLKSTDFFHKDRQKIDGIHPVCRDCRTKQKTRWKEKNPEEHYMRGRAYQLKKFFKLKMDDYKVLLDSQNGCCGICQRHSSEFERSLSVDHDHKAGKIRGLLCGPCNRALGYFADSHDILDKAQIYLNK